MFRYRPQDGEAQGEWGENGCLSFWGKMRNSIQKCDEYRCQRRAVQQGSEPCLDASGTFNVARTYDRGKELPVIPIQNGVGGAIVVNNLVRRGVK